MDRYFPHEKLHCYQLAVEIGRWFRAADFPVGEASLRDQGKRAADSVALNIAEGTRMVGKNRRKHFAYAEASAAEACAVLDLIDIDGAAETQRRLRRVAAMARRLT